LFDDKHFAHDMSDLQRINSIFFRALENDALVVFVDSHHVRFVLEQHGNSLRVAVIRSEEQSRKLVVVVHFHFRATA